MANNRKTPESPSLGREILAVCGVVLAIFIFICLIGYVLPFGKAGISAQSGWGGTVGNFTGLLLLSFLGLSSFWLVLLLLFFSLLSFSPSLSFDRIPHIAAGCSGIVIASCGLFAASKISGPVINGKMYAAGGQLGALLFSLLGDLFGTVGFVLFFLCLLLVSMMLAIRFSPYLASMKTVEILRLLVAWYRERESSEKPLSPAASSTPPDDDNGIVMQAGDNIITIPKVREPVVLPLPENEDEDFQPVAVSPGKFQLPSISLLARSESKVQEVTHEHYYETSRLLEEKLRDFGVEGKVDGISPGPVITTYEFAPAPGVKISKIVALADDLALCLKAESVRIVGSIPGKAALGIEIPNPERNIVHIRDIFAHDIFLKSKAKLTIGLGMDVIGNPVIANLAKMPHLLIAGATGAGKSVGINTIICSLLFKSTPEEVRLLLIDPKRIELSCYEDIPHLLHPVVVDPKMASRALQWAVMEMERRYLLMEEKKVKSIMGFNEVGDEKLPLIVIIIDELADLMMVSSREVEDAVARLAQMARAAGMHLILATQRPSVDVLTGLIKANFPTRMSFKVSSKIDSRTIIDTSGAEHLLGSGDMLFLPPGTSRLQRIHGAYISEEEIKNIVTFVKEQGTARYDESMMQIAAENPDDGTADADEYDEKYDEAVALVCESGQASISMVQRKLRVGYNRAARMIELMEKEGIVGASDGAKPREVLARKKY